jgi:hypothetical protein
MAQRAVLIEGFRLSGWCLCLFLQNCQLKTNSSLVIILVTVFLFSRFVQTVPSILFLLTDSLSDCLDSTPPR